MQRALQAEAERSCPNPAMPLGFPLPYPSPCNTPGPAAPDCPLGTEKRPRWSCLSQPEVLERWGHPDIQPANQRNPLWPTSNCPCDQVNKTLGHMETRAVVPMSQRQWHGPLVLSPGLGALAGGKSRSCCPSPLPGLSTATAVHEAERPPAGAGARAPLRGRWHLQALKPREAGKGGLSCQGSFRVQGGLGILDEDPLVDSRASDYRHRHLLTQPLDLLARSPAHLQDGARTHCPACLSGPKGTQGLVTDGSLPGWFSARLPCTGSRSCAMLGTSSPGQGASGFRPFPTGGGQRTPGQVFFSECFTANAFLCHQGPLLCGHRQQRRRGSLGSMAGRARWDPLPRAPGCSRDHPDFTCFHRDSRWAGVALATSSPKCSSVCAIDKG